jgi:hypothetical protein
MTVFVVQEVEGRNILAASKYGELRVIFPSKTNLMLTTSPAISSARRVLSAFNDEDYLLLMGDPAAIGACCAIAASVNAGSFKVLKWDRQTSMYYSVQFNINKTGTKQDLGELHV